MARFDVFLNPNGNGYLLDVQADILEDLNTRIVIPLMPKAHAPKPASRLNPIIEIEDRDYVLVTQYLAAVPCAILNTRVGNLDHLSERITNALDMAFFGF